MNWQNQFSQNTNTQMASPFPGQDNPSFQSPGIPVQNFPRMAYANPNLIPQETQFPPEVIASAQAANLGTPIREYRKSAVSNNSLANNVQSIIRMTFIGVGITTLIVIAIILFTVPAPFNLLAAGITAVCVLPFIPILLKFSRSAGGSRGIKALVVWSCPEGLVYKQDTQLNTLRWDEVRQIWRKVGMLNGMPTTLAYVVEPTRSAPFSFSMLNGPFADSVLSGNSGGSVSISFGGGEISNNGGFVQISGNYSLTEYAGLGDLIEEQVTQRALPRVLEAYRTGNGVSFGPFALTQQGMSDGRRQLDWNEIDQVQVSVVSILITKKPISMLWFNLSAATLPNFALLCAVLNTIREK